MKGWIIFMLFEDIWSGGGERWEARLEWSWQLLQLAAILSPGQSELRGYLLWQRARAGLAAADQQEGQQQLTTLDRVCGELREVVTILGPIRPDSEEGGMGRQAARELTRLQPRLTTLAQPKHFTSVPAVVKNANKK